MWFEQKLVNLLNRRNSDAPVVGRGFKLGYARPLTVGPSGAIVLRSNEVEHTFVCGRTGCGKTTLLLRLMSEHLRLRVPFFFIDFHGQATDELLAMIGRGASNSDVLLIEPWSDHTLGWNPLESRGDWPYAVVQELVTIFHRRLWADAWGPRLEECLRYTLLALVEAQLTLVDAVSFLSNQEFRRSVLKQVKTQEVLEYWVVRFERLAPSQKSAVAESVLNKVSVFRDPVLKMVLGQRSSTLNFDHALASGQTVLANLSSGKLRGNNYLLAALLVAAFKNAVYRRGPGASSFAVILDEFQELLVLDALDDYLRSFRKFGCPVYLATQHLQLDPTIRAAIFGNCSSFISFAVSATDARYLAAEFGSPDSRLVEEVLLELPVGRAIMKVRGKSAVMLSVSPPAFRYSPQDTERGREMCFARGVTPQTDRPSVKVHPASPAQPKPSPVTKEGTLFVVPRLREGYEDVEL